MQFNTLEITVKSKDCGNGSNYDMLVGVIKELNYEVIFYYITNIQFNWTEDQSELTAIVTYKRE